MTCKNNVSRLISESSFAVILTVREVTFVVDTRQSQGLSVTVIQYVLVSG